MRWRILLFNVLLTFSIHAHALPFEFSLETKSSSGVLDLENFYVQLSSNDRGELNGTFSVLRKDSKMKGLFKLLFLNGDLLEGESYYPSGALRTKFENPWFQTSLPNSRDLLFTLAFTKKNYKRCEYYSEDGKLIYKRAFDALGSFSDSLWFEGNLMGIDQTMLMLKDTSFRYLLMEEIEYRILIEQIESNRTLNPMTGFAFDPNRFIRARIDVDRDILKLQPEYKKFVTIVSRFFKRNKYISLSAKLSNGKISDLYIETDMKAGEGGLLKDLLVRSNITGEIRIYDIPFDGIINFNIYNPASDGC